jgi:hypothetical protein
LAVLALPLLAGCVLAIRRGVRGETQLALTFLLLLGGYGYAIFWLYLIRPWIGVVGSLLLIGGGGGFLWMWRRGNRYRAERRHLIPLLLPLAVCGLSTLLTLQLGFLYGGVSEPSKTAAIRFSQRLPVDNGIPLDFADGLYDGHIERPLRANWLSSDRPPLQSGIYLIERPLAGGYVKLTYQALSVFLQTLWILGLWAWLSAAAIQRRAALLVLAALLSWGFVLVNQFYVWPKLLPTAYLLTICAHLLTPQFGAVRANAAAGAALGLSAGFALLCHGGSLFGLAGIGLTLLLRGRLHRGRLPSWRFLAAAGIAVLCLYLPWVAYQTFYDPPGSGLVKLHLAGAAPDDPRSATAALVDAYAGVSAEAILRNKLANLETVAGDIPDFLAKAFGLAKDMARLDFAAAGEAARLLRLAAFFSLTPALGFLALGLPCLGVVLVRRGGKTAEASTAAWSWLCAMLIVPAWILALYGPGTTSLHNGTYLLPILAAAGSILAAWSLAPTLAVVLCALHALLDFILYVVLIPEAQVSPVVKTAFNPFCALLAALAAAALMALLGRLARSAPPRSCSRPA